MRNVRVIAKLEVKPPNLVKGIQLEGLRKLGNPNDFAVKYYKQGIDEIIYEDQIASLLGRNGILDIIEKTTDNVFVPITVGGGIQSVENVSDALRAGADKISINSAAIQNPSILKDIAKRFGSQCLILSIQAKKQTNSWEPYYDCGREHSGLDAIEWAKLGEQLGVGEILLTSIDQDGTKKGFDIELIRKVTDSVSIPVIASGGMGSCDDIFQAISKGKADAVAIAHVLHYDLFTTAQIKKYCMNKGINIDNYNEDLL
ncbi:MAG: imidazole glycerol phosphate synthase subunit HisF [Candidatus Cloacimonetes bacterium]|nr:imidazole glycerol phosphate synthase subunit HisF [Candidatus Cloacimonadota bacterium]